MAAAVDVFLGIVLAGTSAILLVVAGAAWRRVRTPRSLALAAGFLAFLIKGLVMIGFLLTGMASGAFVTYLLALDCAVVLLLYAGVAVREVRLDVRAADP
jgi:hypothetical protein